MPIDRMTMLGDISGIHRTVLVSALGSYKKLLTKANKAVAEAGGDPHALDDNAEILEEIEKAIGAAAERNMSGTPIGRAMREGESRVVGSIHQSELEFRDPLEPTGVDLQDDGVITMMLDLAGYSQNEDDIRAAVRSWDLVQRRLVWRWSKAMQLVGKPGIYVKVPPRPEFVSVTWLDIDILMDVETGNIDPSTGASVGAMSDEETEKWLSQGPWAPYLKSEAVAGEAHDAKPAVWSLRFNPPETHEGEVPTFAFELESEAAARKLAASINRRLVTDSAVELTVANPPKSNPDAEAPLSELEIMGWHARGPWRVVRDVDETEDPDDLSAAAEADAGWTLEWGWSREEGTVNPVYTMAHDTEAEAMGIAAERNKNYAAEHPPTKSEPAAESAAPEAPAVEGPTTAPNNPRQAWRRSQEKRQVGISEGYARCHIGQASAT
jgi:hypothetical protein